MTSKTDGNMRKGIYPGRIAIVVLLALMGLACNRTSRHNLIGQKKFVNVLVDIHLADGMADDNLKHNTGMLLDSASLYGSVFRKYDVTRAQFDSTMVYYSKHPDDFQKLYNRVTAKLKRIEDELNAETTKEQKKKAPPAGKKKSDK
jgi:hypothetical protein